MAKFQYHRSKYRWFDVAMSFWDDVEKLWKSRKK